MRFFALLSLLLIVLTLQGQASKSVHFGFSATPQMTQQVIKNPAVIDADNQLSWGVRGDLLLKLGESWQMNTGVVYQFVRVDQNDYSIKISCDFVDPFAEMSNSWLEDEFSLHFIGVPIEFKHQPFRRFKNSYLIIGGRPSVNISYQRNTIIHDCRGANPPEPEDTFLNTPRRFMFSASFGVGQEFKLGDQYSLFLEPRVGYALNSLFNELLSTTYATNDSRLLYWGIRLGMIINQ